MSIPVGAVNRMIPAETCAHAEEMVVLVLLNGPPASGKSTIAPRFVDSRPLSLNLDIDVIRGMLGGWLAIHQQPG